MASSDDPDSGLEREKDKKKRPEPKAKFLGVGWIPLKKVKPSPSQIAANFGSEIGRNFDDSSAPPRVVFSMMPSKVTATRPGTMITVSYTLHASRRIQTVVVSISANPASASTWHTVSEWSLDLTGSESTDVYFAPLGVGFSQYADRSVVIRLESFDQNDLLIEQLYSTIV